MARFREVGAVEALGQEAMYELLTGLEDSIVSRLQIWMGKRFESVDSKLAMVECSVERVATSIIGKTCTTPLEEATAFDEQCAVPANGDDVRAVSRGANTGESTFGIGGLIQPGTATTSTPRAEEANMPISVSESNTAANQEDSEDHVFILRKSWDSDHHDTKTSKMDSIMMSSLSEGSSCPQKVDSEKLLADTPRCVLRPAGSFRVAWDLFGFLVILGDVVLVPFQLAFQPPLGPYSQGWFLTALVYWSTDIALNFVTGYFMDGILELRLKQIAIHYVRSWLPFDLVVTGADWIEVFLGGGSSVVSLARTGKTLKMLRAMRSLRLLRLAKLLTLIDTVEQIFLSEWAHIVLRMMKYSCVVVGLNHLIACGWYSIGNMEMAGYENWVRNSKLFVLDTNDNLPYKYSTSLHWSLTQFTPASMAVQPLNVYERVFAVTVLFFALIVFSSFLSSITAGMTQLRQLGAPAHQKITMLRYYLRSRGIDKDLSVRIVRYAEHQIMDKSKKIQEKDVVLLQVLSEPLRWELVQHIYEPLLVRHPFFDYYAQVDSSAMKQVCNSAVAMLALSSADLVFSCGQRSNKMIFVSQGRLLYTLRRELVRRETLSRREGPTASTKSPVSAQSTSSSHALEQYLNDDIKIGGGDWCCEAALWISDVVHFGSLVSITVSKVFTLDAGKFAEATLMYRHVTRASARYAEAFVQSFNELIRVHKINDLPIGRSPAGGEPTVHEEELAKHAFALELFQISRTHSGKSGSFISGFKLTELLMQAANKLKKRKVDESEHHVEGQGRQSKVLAI